MNPNIFKQTTYRAGLLQSKAYRSLTAFMNARLKGHGISLPEWSVIGYLVVSGQPQRPSQIARELAIKQPVASRLVQGLESRGLVEREHDLVDKRSFSVQLTAKGGELAEAVEMNLRAEMKEFLSDVRIEDLAIYLMVMEQIANKI